MAKQIRDDRNRYPLVDLHGTGDNLLLYIRSEAGAGAGTFEVKPRHHGLGRSLPFELKPFSLIRRRMNQSCGRIHPSCPRAFGGYRSTGLQEVCVSPHSGDPDRDLSRFFYSDIFWAKSTMVCLTLWGPVLLGQVRFTTADSYSTRHLSASHSGHSPSQELIRYESSLVFRKKPRFFFLGSPFDTTSGNTTASTWFDILPLAMGNNHQALDSILDCVPVVRSSVNLGPPAPSGGQSLTLDLRTGRQPHEQCGHDRRRYLSNDLTRLEQFARGLFSRLLSSQVMDSAAVARNIEAGGRRSGSPGVSPGILSQPATGRPQCLLAS